MLSKINLLILAFILLSFITAKDVFAQDTVRVSGFDSPRNRFPITNSSGGLPSTFLQTSTIYTHLKNSSLFGQDGTVSCSVEFFPPVISIEPGSLVTSEGNLLQDVFFAGTSRSEPTNEEIEELKKFVEAGGILYLNANLFNDQFDAHGYEYNVLFEAFGLDDRFTVTRLGAGTNQSLTPEIITPLTSGPFGETGQLRYGSYYIFSKVDTNGVIKENSAVNYLTTELAIGKGYLVVSSSVLYINPLISDSDNFKYYMNMFAYACEKKMDNSVVLDVPSFKQGLFPFNNNDPLWESLTYDDARNIDLDCGVTMAQCGCALTSAAMVMKYHGVEKTAAGDFLNPGLLNIYAQGWLPNGGFSGFSFGNFRWEYAANFSAQAHDNFPNQFKVDLPLREDFNTENIIEHIDNGRPVIVKVLGQFGVHWVVVKGYDPDDNRLIINDPVFPDKFDGYTFLDEKYTPAQIGSTIVYEPTMSDFRYLQFSFLSGNNILVTDKYGNKTGYDPESGVIVNQIPNSDYIFEEYYGDATSDTTPESQDGIMFLTIKLPEDGKFNFDVFSDNSEDLNVQIHSSNKNGGLTGFNLDVPINNSNYYINYNQDTAGEEVEIIVEAKIKISPTSSNGFIIPYKNVPVPVVLFGSEDFDVIDIDQETLTFGKTGEEESLIGCDKKLRDINSDGYDDLECKFYGGLTGFDLEDLVGVLKGVWKNINFEGSDSMLVHKPWPLVN